MNVSIITAILLVLTIGSQIFADNSYVCSNEKIKHDIEDSNQCVNNEWSPTISAEKDKEKEKRLHCCVARERVCMRIKLLKQKCEIKNQSAFDSYEKTEYEREGLCKDLNPTVGDCKALFKRDQRPTRGECFLEMPCDWSAHFPKPTGSLGTPPIGTVGVAPSGTVGSDGNGDVESSNSTITLKIPDPTNVADNLIPVGSMSSCLALILSIIIYF